MKKLSLTLVTVGAAIFLASCSMPNLDLSNISFSGGKTCKVTTLRAGGATTPVASGKSKSSVINKCISTYQSWGIKDNRSQCETLVSSQCPNLK